MEKKREKNLALAIGLNILLPGIGYMYMGKIFLGIAALVIVLAIFFNSSMFTIGTAWMVMNAIMAIDMIVLHGKNKKEIAAAALRKFPRCAEMIQKEAKVCRFCGFEF